MATVHQPAPAARRPPAADAPGGEPVSVVHVTAEYFPYARTGGLAEAVSGLAQLPAGGRAQRRSRSSRSTARSATSSPTSSRSGPPFLVPIGGRTEEARVFRVAGAGDRARRSSSSSTSTTSTGPASTARTRSTIPTTPAASPSSRWRRSPRCPGSCQRPGAAPRPRLAHGARAGLSPDHARRASASARAATHRALGAQPGLPGALPARGDARHRAALGALQLAAARVVRQGELAEGRAGLRRLRHHGEPHPGRASSARRAAASACTTCFIGWATGWSACSTGSTSASGTRPPTRRSPPSTRPTSSRASAAARRRCSARSGCRSGARRRSSA